MELLAGVEIGLLTGGQQELIVFGVEVVHELGGEVEPLPEIGGGKHRFERPVVAGEDLAGRPLVVVVSRGGPDVQAGNNVEVGTEVPTERNRAEDDVADPGLVGVDDGFGVAGGRTEFEVGTVVGDEEVRCPAGPEQGIGAHVDESGHLGHHVARKLPDTVPRVVHQTVFLSEEQVVDQIGSRRGHGPDDKVLSPVRIVLSSSRPALGGKKESQSECN